MGADYAGDTNLYLLTLAQVNNALAARANAVVRVVCAASPSITKENPYDTFADPCGAAV